MDQMVTPPQLTSGGLHVDQRGIVTFFNDFNFKGIDRFYLIRPHHPRMPRGWVGHKRDHKWFTAVQGTILVAVVAPDDWEHPGNDLPVARYVLSSANPQVLHVPPGHATGTAALSQDALLMIFSSGRMGEQPVDDFRYPSDQWKIME